MTAPALFPTPPRRPPSWTHTHTRAFHYFDIQHAPDIHDQRTTRRRVMRPARLIVRTIDLTVQVVWIYGPAVRRNGTQTRTYTTIPDPAQLDPTWLDELLYRHGLVFPRSPQ